MDKLKMHSPDITHDNIVKIRELFPGCVTEAQAPDGSVVLAVDFDNLRQELSNQIVEGPTERFRLDWPGKRESLLIANSQISKTLRPDYEASVNFEKTKNLFIEGDNLEALKLLQESYLGKVKIVYIDPPYNTGNDFVYQDRFSETSTEYLEKSGEASTCAGKLVANPTTEGRFHSRWLQMMYPRLKLIRNLLTEDGFLFISIDDWESGNLRVMVEEIFGRENFVGLFCRKTKSGGGSAAGTCAVEHDYVLVFAKTSSAAPLIEKYTDEYLKRYQEQDEHGPYFWDTMERSSTATKPYLIEAPDGTMLSGKWFRAEETFKKDLKKGEVRFLQKDDGWSVQFKQRLADGKKFRTILEESDLTDKSYRSLNAELESLIGSSLGHPPKPLKLLETLIYSASSNNERCIVADFFSGSGTTGHAVYSLNSKDSVDRRFILVQLPEECPEDSQAFKMGYKTVSELSQARLKAGGQAVLGSANQPDWDKDIGFRVLRIDDSNMRDVYYTPDQTDQMNLLNSADNVKPDRSSEDLLFQVLVDWGVDLTLPISSVSIQGKQVFFIDDNALVACFDTGVTEELVTELAKSEPLRVVFRDNGFVTDSVKINVEQIFKQLSPMTDVKAI